MERVPKFMFEGTRDKQNMSIISPMKAPYRVSLAEMKVLNVQLRELLDKGYI